MANKDDSWDGKLSNIRISPHAYPELHTELSSMYHKERSDRLRSLALIGLLALRGSFTPSPSNFNNAAIIAGTSDSQGAIGISLKKKAGLTAKVSEWG